MEINSGERESEKKSEKSETNLENNSGYLEIIIGPMFSGKTSAMLRKLSFFADIGFKVLLINHSHDTRASNLDRNKMLSSHSSQFLGISGKLEIIKASNLNLEVDNYDVIGIDEVQFFEDIQKVIDFVEIKNKRVYVCGLDGDFKREKIGDVFSLIPKCDKIEKLNAKCHECINKYKNNFSLIQDSPFTHRTIKNDSQILIGAQDSYESLCRYHYLSKQEKKTPIPVFSQACEEKIKTLDEDDYPSRGYFL